MKRAWTYVIIEKCSLLVFAFILGCTITLSFMHIEKTGDGCVLPPVPLQTKQSQMASDKTDTKFLMIIILTAPGNVDQRQAIRDTWLNLRPTNVISSLLNLGFLEYNANGFLQQESVLDQKRFLEKYQMSLATASPGRSNELIPQLNVGHYFSIGSRGLADGEKRKLLEEKRLHQDLLIMDELQDSYSNLTRKLQMTFEMLDTKVPFKYLLKTDDDTYVKLDQLLADLYQYDEQIATKQLPIGQPAVELYWGYFNGHAQVKKRGQWKETNFNMCERYLPYALGGGYLLSHGLVKRIASNANVFSTYGSEDISLGMWLSPLRNIYRRHDVRFDTAWMPRKCKNYHIVWHKRTTKDMYSLYRDSLCPTKEPNTSKVKRPVEYFYDWTATQMRCCENLVP